MKQSTYARALDALKPLYDSVFNDNGDITVEGPYPYEVAVAGYFAYKRLRDDPPLPEPPTSANMVP